MINKINYLISSKILFSETIKGRPSRFGLPATVTINLS